MRGKDNDSRAEGGQYFRTGRYNFIIKEKMTTLENNLYKILFDVTDKKITPSLKIERPIFWLQPIFWFKMYNKRSEQCTPLVH